MANTEFKRKLRRLQAMNRRRQQAVDRVRGLNNRPHFGPPPKEKLSEDRIDSMIREIEDTIFQQARQLENAAMAFEHPLGQQPLGVKWTEVTHKPASRGYAVATRVTYTEDVVLHTPPAPAPAPKVEEKPKCPVCNRVNCTKAEEEHEKALMPMVIVLPKRSWLQRLIDFFWF